MSRGDGDRFRPSSREAQRVQDGVCPENMPGSIASGPGVMVLSVGDQKETESEAREVVYGIFVLISSGNASNNDLIGLTCDSEEVVPIESVGELALEDGEINNGMEEDDLEGDFDGFGEFYENIEFDMGVDCEGEYGTNQLFLEEQILGTYDLFIDGLMGNDAVVPLQKNNEEDTELLQVLEMAEGVVKDVDKDQEEHGTYLEMLDSSDAVKDIKKKNVKAMVPIVGANSQKRLVATLDSPRRTVPPEGVFGVKDAAKEKNGKVDLPKLPAGS